MFCDFFLVKGPKTEPKTLGQTHSLNKLANSSMDLCVQPGAESGVLDQEKELPDVV